MFSNLLCLSCLFYLIAAQESESIFDSGALQQPTASFVNQFKNSQIQSIKSNDSFNSSRKNENILTLAEQKAILSAKQTPALSHDHDFMTPSTSKPIKQNPFFLHVMRYFDGISKLNAKVVINGSTIHVIPPTEEKLHTTRRLVAFENVQQKPCDHRVASLLPGSQYLNLGYNFISDAPVFGSRVFLLDGTESTQEHTKAIEYFGSCYKIPDAFVSSDGRTTGLRFDNSFVESKFKTLGAESAKDHLNAEGLARKSEINLDAIGLDFDSGIAFSQSKSTLKQINVQTTKSLDSSSAKMYVQLFSLEVLDPIPSDSCIDSWAHLYVDYKSMKDPSKAFQEYFESIGTHYHSYIGVGGELRTQFSVSNTFNQSENSTEDNRARCIGLKLGASFSPALGTHANLDVCSDAFEGDHLQTNARDYISSMDVECIGGVEGCPSADDLLIANNQVSDEDFISAKINWALAIAINPSPLSNGKKQWISDLMEYLATSYTQYGRLPKKLNDFGTRVRELKERKKGNYQKIASDVDDPVQQREYAEWLIELAQAFREYIVIVYKKDNNFCKTYPHDKYCKMEEKQTEELEFLEKYFYQD